MRGPTVRLEGRRVLVVGASSGIGRASALAAARAGADLVVAARRSAPLEGLVGEADGGTAVVADVTDPSSCHALAEAATVRGPLDLVVCSAGMARMTPMAEAAVRDWSDVLATNVVGLNQAIRYLVPVMAPDGIVAVLSSDTVGHPRWALGPYGASKAAVDQSLLSWRMEHPEVRFTRVTIGGTMPTGFADAFSMDVISRALEEWVRHGTMQQRQMDTDELAGALIAVLADILSHPGVGLEELTLRSPSPPAAATDELEL